MTVWWAGRSHNLPGSVTEAAEPQMQKWGRVESGSGMVGEASTGSTRNEERNYGKSDD
jgi:hypothetical protein